MKKIVIIMIAALLMCSCGNKTKNVNDNGTDSTTVEVVDSVEVNDSI